MGMVFGPGSIVWFGSATNTLRIVSAPADAAAVALLLGFVGALTDSKVWSSALIVMSIVLAIDCTLVVLMNRSRPTVAGVGSEQGECGTMHSVR